MTVPPDSIPISSPQELLAFIASGDPDGNYHLVSDIDLEGETVSGSSIYFSGIFNGQGYTIENAVINASGNKMGFLFKQLSSGGIIQNVNFENCIHNGGGSSESSAFVSAFAQGGSAFLNLAFRNVSVIHTGSYAGLLFGDVTADSLDPEDKITIRNITLINDENNKIQGGDYMGGLIGAARKFVKIEMENIYFDSEVRSTGSQTTGILMARDNSANVELYVNNVVIKGSLTSAKDTGVILGRSSAGTKVIATNVFLSDLVVSSGNSAMNIVIGNQAAGSIKSYENVYYNSESAVFNVAGSPASVTDGSPLQASLITESWFEASNFDQAFFKYQNQSIVRNIDHVGPIEETGITVILANVKTTYLVGESLDFDQMKVYLNYSDDSLLQLETTDYTIVQNAFDNTMTGSYEIIINYGSWSDSFTVLVIEVTALEVDALLFKDAYLVGSSLDFSNLAVRARLSDGGEMPLSLDDYQLDQSLFNSQVPGTYDLTFTYSDLPQVTIKVHVVSETVSIEDNKVTLFVDQNYDGPIGALGGSGYNFKTIKQAFQHLANLDLAPEVEKIINVASGTYYEKVALQVPNVRLVGSGRETTTIVYDAASGLKSPFGANWGTQGSATVAIKSAAYGFLCANITFANSFDYLNSSIGDKQAVALVNEADKAIYFNCGFEGYQDTLYAKYGRQYYFNVYIEGVVDFIFGNGGPAYFEDSIIKMLARPTSGGCLSTNKGYATSEAQLLDYGYVFYHNDLVASMEVAQNSIFLGRPWGANAAIAYIDNVFGAHISTTGWTDMSGNLPENARFYEYQNKSVDSDILNTTLKGKTLTETEALAYIDKDVVFQRLNGD
ncbi:MAG: pectinesterase family protein, partial [Candidatus Izemoplasmatales bacterium]